MLACIVRRAAVTGRLDAPWGDRCSTERAYTAVLYGQQSASATGSETNEFLRRAQDTALLVRARYRVELLPAEDLGWIGTAACEDYPGDPP